MGPRHEDTDLYSVWTSRGIDAASLAPDGDGTIRPSSLTLPPLDPSVSQSLPPLSVDGGGISVGETLGQGGMGVVKRARQLPLGRDVAVKVVRDPQQPGRAAAQLLREARVTGALEHPNVVPIHALCRDEHGAPVIVMKRIDGVAWREFIRDPRHPARPGDETDILEFHLSVFLQVCSAMQFAHSKKIIHRDLKPDNVMVGAFGEVYVLDWGLALATGEEPPTEVLPRARDVCAIAGTPEYMAPEQASADGSQIDERTDIYQLGAILHECVTGQPRHQGSVVKEILQSAYLSLPVQYGRSVPEELAAICNRAMAADPARRYQTVGELRNAVVAFRRHRSSATLARESSGRLDVLRAMLEGMEDGTSTLHEVQMHGLFSECRFGFQQALATWPESAEAREGLRAAQMLMAEFEVARGNLRAATVMAAELDPPSPELSAKVRALRARVAEETERTASLERLQQSMDSQVGARTRVWLTFFTGVLLAAIPAVLALGVRAGWIPYRNWIPGILVAGFCLFCPLAHWLTRAEMNRTEVNRRIVRVGYALCLSMLAVLLASVAVGLEAPRTMALLLLTNGLVLGGTAAALHPRTLWTALPLLVGGALALHAPGASLELAAGSNLVSHSLMAYLWHAGPPDGPQGGQPRSAPPTSSTHGRSTGPV